ncbi:MAG: hypothetical protein QW835_00285 [Candidatus Hadarchaeum sp.]
MHTVIPEQNIYLDPYRQPPFDYNNVYSQVYHSYLINQLFKVFGDNCVIDGFDFVHYDIDQDGKIYVTVGPGKAMAASTLVVVDQEVEVDLDVSVFPPGSIIVVLEYLPELKVEPNRAKVKIHYVWDDGQIYPETWVERAGNVILGLFYFTKSPYTVFYDRGVGRRIKILDRLYDVRPPTALAESYVRETPLICEAVIVTQEMVADGWFDLSHMPLSPYLVEVFDLNSGLSYTSNNILGAGGDFLVEDRRVHIRGADISGAIMEGDVLHIKYLSGGR